MVGSASSTLENRSYPGGHTPDVDANIDNGEFSVPCGFVTAPTVAWK